MTSWTVEQSLVDPSSDSRKFLLRSTRDRVLIESVLVWFAGQRKASICASVQRGCPVGCLFCATTFAPVPFQGNLTADELVDEVNAVITEGAEVWAKAEQHVVVYEGHGDVALNLDAALEATRRLRAQHPTLRFKMVSCCPGDFLERLLALPAEVLVPELRISLHAPDQARRGAVIPSARHQDLGVLVDQALALARQRRFEVTWGYLVHTGNCADADARALVDWLRPGVGHFKLRLLPMNPVEGSPLVPVSPAALATFQDQVAALLPAGLALDRHVNFGRADHLRFACGQLRAHAPSP